MRQIDKPLFYKLINQIEYQKYPNHLDRNNLPKAFHFPVGIEGCVKNQLLEYFYRKEINYSDFSGFLQALFRPASWSSRACLLDFCISHLSLQHDYKKWQVVRELIQYCYFIFLFENICIICDRPCKLLFDQKNLLHAEWEYALQFADGYGVYAHHGGKISEGKQCHDGKYIQPGTRVKLPSTGEYGIVTHCWYNDRCFDCYVAFYGTSFPDKETNCKPYILRYAAVSLEVIE